MPRAQRRQIMTLAAASTTQTDRLAQQQTFVYQQMQLLMDAATREERPFTAEEDRKFTELKEQHAQFDKRLASAQSDDKLRAEFAAIASGGTRRTTPAPGGSPGALFAANEDVRRFI